MLQAVTVPEPGTGLKPEGRGAEVPRWSERSSGGGRDEWDLLCDLLHKSFIEAPWLVAKGVWVSVGVSENGKTRS